MINGIAHGQIDEKVNRVEQIYLAGDFSEEDHLKILDTLSRNHKNTEKRLQFSEELIQKAQEMDSVEYLFGGYMEKANTLQKKGDLSLALEYYLLAEEIANAENHNVWLGKTYGSIGNVYSVMGNATNSINYFKKSLSILDAEEDHLAYALTLENLGDQYLHQKLPDSALIYLNLSEPIFRQEDFQIGLAYNLGNKGLAYAQKNRNDLAEDYINQASDILTELSDFYPICIYLIYMADIYIEKGDIQKASDFAERSLNLAKNIGLKPQASEASLKLSEIYELAENQEASLHYFKEHIAYRDSVMNIETVQEIADMRTNLEVAKKQSEVDLLNQQKTNQRVLIFTMVVILGMTGLYYRNISKEKKRSDDLLLNILPTKTAEELKEKGKVQAKKFESVTVMFTDFTAFTKHSQKLSPEVLVKSVDHYFSKFDTIIDKYGLEKIKTIGDAYMCAGGLPFKTIDHGKKMVKAAMEIASFVKTSRDSKREDIAHFDIRIGINTGPVVAGVVGSKKFAYDIWGDTVNVAARMESNSESGMINISENTYALVKKDFDCEYRGEIDVKNKGMMKMYFVHPKKQGFYDQDKVKQSKPESRFIKKDNIHI
jgi:class 3 adenylate cyclase